MKPSRARISFTIGSAIVSASRESRSVVKNSPASSMVILTTSSMLKRFLVLPAPDSTNTCNASVRSRACPHDSQADALRYVESRCFTNSLSVVSKRRWMLGITPSKCVP